MEKRDKKVIIISHEDPDIDSIFSTLAIIYFFLGIKDLIKFFQNSDWRDVIVLKPANWDGKGMGPNNIAVDIHAGGRGIKGEIIEGKTYSAFNSVMSKYAPKEMNEALADFICYVDTFDSTGDVLKTLAGDYMGNLSFAQDYMDILRTGSLESQIQGVKSYLRRYGHEGQKDLIAHYALPFLAQIKIAKQKIRAKEMYSSRVVSLLPDKKSPVCIKMTDAPFEICDLAFARGAEVMVFYGQKIKGNEMMGVKRRPGSDFPVSHPRIMEVIKKKGEFWYCCDHLIATGTPKGPPKFQTKVLVSSLCVAVQSVYRELYTKK
jgi:hypothetical protein